MTSVLRAASLGAAALALLGGRVLAQPPAETEVPEVKPLGDERFQIGAIVVDQRARTLTVGGRVLRTEPPLEYIAVAVGGVKGYESLLELDATGVEFNLACILIGLSNEEVVLPRYQFDLEPVVGPQVGLRVRWGSGAEQKEYDAAEVLWTDGKPGAGGDWIYTGSYNDAGDPSPYMAQVLGTLIGFVHDPAAIIEHRVGIGIGAYGSIGGNLDLLPDVGAELTLVVENRRAASR
ncbi:MAG TPA: YdjY domain-containing protein [Gammaproteobacteria bacterium]|nr:YdjY domain-containing protein [Gammaproteobacteria bacterium]